MLDILIRVEATLLSGMLEGIGLGIDDRVTSSVKRGIFELDMAGQLVKQDKAEKPPPSR